MQRSLSFLITAAAALGLLVCLGCGGYNTELSRIHREGLDCSNTNPGCHPSAGAAGTVYTDFTGTAPLPGAVVRAWTGPQSIVLGRTDSQGNFLYRPPIEGAYIMDVDGMTSTTLHALPGWNGCNWCHTHPPNPDVPASQQPDGRLRGAAASSP